MIKVETAINPELMRSNTYIWIPGMTWQVPEDEEQRVLKLEVFGGELALITADEQVANAETVRNESGHVLERVWYGVHARAICKYMREQFIEPR